MSERSLAHVEEVVDIQPIEGADRIELVTILGWKVIQAKNTVHIGDKVVYIEIDSKVPATGAFAFMEHRKYRVKTMRMRGVYSQGLIMTFSDLGLDPDKFEVGEDVTDLLKIVKYESKEEIRLKKESSARDVRIDRVYVRHYKFAKSKLGTLLMKHKFTREIVLKLLGGKKAKPRAWPDFITKTDETRIENLPWELNNKEPLEVTEKLDGTSTTFFIKKKKHGKKRYEFGVCSRNVRQLDRDQACYHDANIYWEMAIKYDVENVLRDLAEIQGYPDNIVLQGESVGNVQGNPLQLTENDFYAFNLIIEGKKVDSVKAAQIMADYNIKWVPILQTDFVCPDTMEEMKLLAKGKSVINPQEWREGCVYRDAENTRSFKNVDREYLLKHSE